MKKFIWVSIVSAFAFLGTGQVSLAATTPAFETAFEEFMTTSESISSADYSYMVSLLDYEVDGEEPVGGVVASAEGWSRKQGDKIPFYETKGSAKFTYGQGDQVYTTEMEVIAKGNNIYIRFVDPSEKKLDGKWTKMTYAQYQALGKTLKREALFTIALESSSNETIDTFEKGNTLAEKHKVYVPFGDPVYDEVDGVSVVGYQYEYNRATIVGYFKAQKKLLSKEEREDTLFGIEGFEKGLSKKAFVDEMVDRSVITFWFEEETGNPAGFSSVTVLPPSGKRKMETHFTMEMFLSNPNKVMVVKEPTKFMTYKELKKLLKIKG